MHKIYLCQHLCTRGNQQSAISRGAGISIIGRNLGISQEIDIVLKTKDFRRLGI